jgi:ABC-type sugar transport system ATPase subunit
MTTSKLLRLRDLRKTFPDGTAAVKGIDLDMAEGALVVLLGPSGCGKTTTLRMIAGLEIPSGGTIEIDGRDVTRLRPSQRDVGFVFQFYALYPHMPVRGNIGFPLLDSGMSRAEQAQRVLEVSQRVGLAGLLDRFPPQLSGGDRQRVALARAMVRRPRLWLMDEPLGTLDADHRLQMREFIRRQQLDLGITTVYVTHDQEEAMNLADRIVVMNEGIIRQVGTPQEVYDRPADLFVAHFVGSPGMNFIEGRWEPDGTFMAGSTAIEAARLPGLRAGPVTLGVRPEHIGIASKTGIAAKIAVQQFLGSHRLLHLESAIGSLVMRAADAAGSVGDSIRVAFDSNHLNFFEWETGTRL